MRPRSRSNKRSSETSSRGPLITIQLSEGEARSVGTGYRVFVVLLVGRRWAQLFAPATLRRIALPRPAFDRFASEARGCRSARVASIIRRNLGIAKRTELARFDRARPWARAAIARLEAAAGSAGRSARQ
jgi:hypothetical protein